MKALIMSIVTALFLIACNDSGHNEDGHSHEGNEESGHHKHEEGHGDEVHFSEQQFQSLDMKTDTLPLRNLSSYIEANGQLEVLPQYEAVVTAIIGANVTTIKVIEGDKVNKGQVLAYLSHPDLITLQTGYVKSWFQLQYLEQEYQRQETLYEEKVGSGKEFQKIWADYQSMKGMVKGYEAQLDIMELNIEKVRQGDIYEQVPVLSPIEGHIRSVKVKTGQFVEPQSEIFEIVNSDHIHADFMVFEKDMHKVKEGQKIDFSVESLPDKQLKATVFAVGKTFEQSPKAIHLHAEIDSKKGFLIPGMYIRGRILTDSGQSYALPEAGVVREGGKYFIFTAEKEIDNGNSGWAFHPIEVMVGKRDNNWIEIKLFKPLEKSTAVAWNNAYYLLAEMKKGEAEHSH